jgi:uncharacterized membrane protein
MMLAPALVGFLLRHFRSWRLTWQPSLKLAPTKQFQIADALLWTTLVSAGLAAVRFLVSLDNGFPDL